MIDSLRGTVLLIVLAWLACTRIVLSAERYFPDGPLTDGAKMDEREHNRYAATLKAFGEPSLMTTVEKDEVKNKRVFRFTWLRSFHRPVCIVIDAGDRITLTMKLLDGKSGYRVGELAWRKSINVDAAEFDKFLALLDDADYWSMSPISKTREMWVWNSHDHKWGQQWLGGYDGADWILEYCSENEYRFVERWSPSKTAFAKACVHLITLAGIEDEKIY